MDALVDNDSASSDILVLKEGTVTILLVSHPAERPDRGLEARLAEAGFSVRRVAAADVEEVLAAGEPPLAVILELAAVRGSDPYAVVSRVARATSAPVLVSGPDDGDALLTYEATGAAGHLPAGADADQLRALILIARERRLTRLELQRAHHGYRKLFDDSPVALAFVDVQGRISEANPAFSELTGFSRDDLDRLTAADLARLMDPADGDTVSYFERFAAGDVDAHEERMRLVRRDGTEVWADLMTKPLRDPISAERYLMLELHNVDPEMEARHALEVGLERYRTLFDHNPVPTLLLDLGSSRFATANPAAEEAYGYRREELLELGPLDLWIVTDANEELYENLLHGRDQFGPVRVLHRHRSGDVFEMEVLSVYVDDDGAPARLILARDVSAQRQLDAALDRALRERTIRRLAAVLARTLHRLARLLVAEGDELAQLVPAETGGRGQTRHLRRTGRQAAQLAEVLLSLAGEEDREPEILELNSALAPRLENLRELADESTMVSFEPAPVELPVRISPLVLDGLLSTIMIHSWDPRLGQRHVVASTDRRPDRDVAVLALRDGVGRQGGLEFGLGALERLVQNSGGHLHLEQGHGAEATLRIEFPLHGHGSDDRPGTDDTTPGRTGTILLVDDDDAVRLLITEMLERAGYRVVPMASSRQALGAAAELDTIDVLISDANLGNPDTAEMISRLRRRHPGLRTLIVSGYLDDALSALGSVGADVPFLSKPFSTSELIGRVEKLLSAP